MPITVRAPATVANLGPGFDCLAVALDIGNEFTVDVEAEPGVRLEGEGRDELPADATNLVCRTMALVEHETGGSLPPFALACVNRIPLQRGLGSSAAAVVGGALLADRILGAGLGSDAFLRIAADVEGHADNVAACLLGGLVLTYPTESGWRTERLEPHPDLRLVVLVPEHERLATRDARQALPPQVPHADAAFTAGRAALVVHALTARPDLLGDALEDRLHQPYRLTMSPAVRSLFDELRRAAIPVCLAGTGPALLAFERPAAEVWDPGPGWRVLRPRIYRSGATVEDR
jgi:homoserine kinase